MDWSSASPQMSIIPRAGRDKATTGGSQATGVREHVSQRQDTSRKSPSGSRQCLSGRQQRDRKPPHVLGESNNKGGIWCVGPETFRTAGGAKIIGKSQTMDKKNDGKVESVDQILKSRKEKFNLQMKQLNNVMETRNERDHLAKVTKDVKRELSKNGAITSIVETISEGIYTTNASNAICSPTSAAQTLSKFSKVQQSRHSAISRQDKADFAARNLSPTKAWSQTSSERGKQMEKREEKHEKLTRREPSRTEERVKNSHTVNSSMPIYESPIQESCCITTKYSNGNIGEILSFSSESVEPDKKMKGNIIQKSATTNSKQNKSCKKDHYLLGLTNLAQHESTDLGDLGPKYETCQDLQVKQTRKVTAQIGNTSNESGKHAKKILHAVHTNEVSLTDFTAGILKHFHVLSMSKETATLTKHLPELYNSSYDKDLFEVKEFNLGEKTLESSCSSDSGFESLIDECSKVENNTVDVYLNESPKFTVGSSTTSYCESSAASFSSYESFEEDSRSPSPEVDPIKNKTLDLWLNLDKRKKCETKKSLNLNSPYSKTQLPPFSKVEREVVSYLQDFVNLMTDKSSSIVKDLQTKYEHILPKCAIKPPKPLKIKKADGELDKKGKLHGEAEIYYENGDYFWGDLVHGLREGMASYIVKKTDDNFMGRYKKDQLDGFVVESISFCDRDCVEREVFYSNGIRHGFYREFDRTKQFWSIGRFENGEKTGIHWKWYEGNGFNIGELSQNNEPIGDSFYLYPDLFTVIRGWYENGKLKKGEQVKMAGYDDQYGIPFPKVSAMPSETFYYSPSQATVIAKRLHLRDPYESRYVFVDHSTIPFAGEGLFAKQDIKNGQLCAVFNGVRQRKLWGSKNENDVWSDYRITVTRDVDLDIWKEHESLANYSATLAHKCCHSFVQNAGFQRLDHPQYGQIMSVVAMADIPAGQEILVSYNYTIPKAPLWYQEVWFSHCRDHLNWTEEQVLKWTEKTTRKSGITIVPLPPPKDSQRFVPCGECREHVGLYGCSVMCELCMEWHHMECVKDLDIKTIDEEKRENFEWFCKSCSWKSGTKG